MKCYVEKKIIRFAGILLILISLTSCSITSRQYPYPADWAHIQNDPSNISCPILEGIYYDLGEKATFSSGHPCVIKAGECGSLSFNLLFSDNLAGLSVTRPLVNQIHITQPSPDVLEITTKPNGEQHKLSISNGDFSCDGAGLRLETKYTTAIAIIANYIQSESRVFNVANDGTLTMNAENRSVGHHLILPVNNTWNRWVRWSRVTDFTPMTAK